LGFLNTILLEPILNILLVLTHFLFSNFGLGVIALTILVRMILLPLNIIQLRSSKKTTAAMNEIKPKLEQLKKKYAKNPQKLNQETMKLYKEAGISPLGCLSSPMFLSLIIQLPVFIALYRAVVEALATTPQDFLGLSQNLYSWSMVNQGLPISDRFLWLHLQNPDSIFIIPILVAGTQWLSQKMIIQPSTDPQQQSMNTMMQIMMPLMFGFLCLSFPSGLGLYFLITNIITIVVQGFVYGWGSLLFFKKAPAAQTDVKKSGKPDKSEGAKDATADSSKDNKDNTKGGGSFFGGLFGGSKPKHGDQEENNEKSD
jgi:YidC/Oxa1 family membrane protein insertase